MNSFGAIISCMVKDFDLNYDVVTSAFHDAGYDERFIPGERTAVKAFSKAVGEATEGEDFLIRPIKKKGKTVICGLVHEEKNEEQKNLKYDVSNVLTLNGEIDTIEGKSDFRVDSIKESYLKYRNMTGMVELALKLKVLFFELMAIEVLNRKVIFIPSRFETDVKKLSKLFDLLKKAGVPCHIEIMNVDDGTTTRDTIIKCLSAQTIEFLQEKIDYCKEQKQKFDNGTIKYLRPTAFNKMLDKVTTVEARIRSYIQILSLKPDEAQPIIAKLEEAHEAIGKNLELAQATTGKAKKLKAQLSAELPI